MNIFLLIVVVVIIPLGFGQLGAAIARNKNRNSFRWRLFSIVFPPAILVVLLLPSLKPTPSSLIDFDLLS